MVKITTHMRYGSPALTIKNILHENAKAISQKRYCIKLNMIMINNTISVEDILFDSKGKHTSEEEIIIE